MTIIEEHERRDIELAKQAWADKKAGKDWEAWVRIGRGLEVLRVQTMRELHMQNPVGKKWSAGFGAKLAAEGLDDIDKGTRSHLLDCMDHLVEIEAWRKTRSATERLEWASPRSVLRHWRASVAVPAKQAVVTSPVAALKARIVELEEELHRLKKAEDEGGVTLSHHDSAGDSVKAIRDMYRQQASKLRTLAHGLLREADSIEGKAERAKKK